MCRPTRMGAFIRLAWLVALLPIAASLSAPRDDAWIRSLIRPAPNPRSLPKEWKLFIEPKDFTPKGASTSCGIGWEIPETVDELTRASTIVAVGEGVGSDGSFHPVSGKGKPSPFQYTTYYLKVLGYLKDGTGRRARYLKVLAPGGFLDGGLRGDERVPVPYIATGHRYLLYFTPNHKLPWGWKGNTEEPIGGGDEYWPTGMGYGYWFEDEKGRLSTYGFVDRSLWPQLGLGCPLKEAVRRVLFAVSRERQGVPLPKRARPPLMEDERSGETSHVFTRSNAG